MPRIPKITPQTLRVLEALIFQPGLSGAELAKLTHLQTGTLYPILLRLEGAGWAVSQWEEGDPKELGRPRRRYYTATGDGVRAAKSAVGEMRIAAGRLAWS